MSPLPNWQHAEIDPSKFSDYAMNAAHPDNQEKWLAFRAIGYRTLTALQRSEAALDLSQRIRTALGSIDAEVQESSPWGDRHTVRIPLVGPDGGHALAVTVWQYDHGADWPRLITMWLRVRPQEGPR